MSTTLSKMDSLFCQSHSSEQQDCNHLSSIGFSLCDHVRSYFAYWRKIGGSEWLQTVPSEWLYTTPNSVLATQGHPRMARITATHMQAKPPSAWELSMSYCCMRLSTIMIMAHQYHYRRKSHHTCFHATELPVAALTNGVTVQTEPQSSACKQYAFWPSKVQSHSHLFPDHPKPKKTETPWPEFVQHLWLHWLLVGCIPDLYSYPFNQYFL